MPASQRPRGLGAAAVANHAATDRVGDDGRDPDHDGRAEVRAHPVNRDVGDDQVDDDQARRSSRRVPAGLRARPTAGGSTRAARGSSRSGTRSRRRSSPRRVPSWCSRSRRRSRWRGRCRRRSRSATTRSGSPSGRACSDTIAPTDGSRPDRLARDDDATAGDHMSLLWAGLIVIVASRRDDQRDAVRPPEGARGQLLRGRRPRRRRVRRDRDRVRGDARVRHLPRLRELRHLALGRRGRGAGRGPAVPDGTALPRRRPRSRCRTTLVCYARNVVDIEWPQMRSGSSAT